ncbi:MAG: NUDIX domain-containing protein [Anaerolineales bacterium]|nr:NUDIX domain-containing protein [Anaerolineales bacterium]
MTVLEKVTAFITRQTPAGTELLLFHHPSAGIQFPAGTVEPDEAPEAAAAREAAEETGLSGLRLVEFVGVREEDPPLGDHCIARTTTVYSRPDPSSFDWATLRRGLTVQLLRRADGYAQVTFEEPDRWPNPQYATYQITGWVPEETLCRTARRYFYLFTHDGDTPEQWTVAIDHHLYAPFWAPLTGIPEIVSPQRPWLEIILKHLGANR